MATNFEQYIREKYDNDADWFVKAVNEVNSQKRVNDIHDLKLYLDGDHQILYRPDEQYRGRTYKTRKVVLQYAKTILEFATSFLLNNPVTISGEQSAVKKMQKVYKSASYNQIDYNLLFRMLAYGASYEYLYFDGNRNIKSHVIDTESSFPIYNEVGELIGFVESWVDDGISYYVVYTNDVVYRYSNKGSRIHLIAQNYNPSGLPVPYVNASQSNPNYGRSDLEDYISILDTLEYLISKSVDGYSHYITGIPVIKGSVNFDPQIPKDIIGAGLSVDDNSDFNFVSNNFDNKAFKTLYDTLMQELLDVAHLPQAAFSNASIANVSETTIRMMYSIAKLKSSLNKKLLDKGFEQRFNKIRKMLALKGVTFSDEGFDSLSIVYTEDIPQNEGEVIGNLSKLREFGGLSLQSTIERNPYTNNVDEELKRLRDEMEDENMNGVENNEE